MIRIKENQVYTIRGSCKLFMRRIPSSNLPYQSASLWKDKWASIHLPYLQAIQSLSQRPRSHLVGIVADSHRSWAPLSPCTWYRSECDESMVTFGQVFGSKWNMWDTNHWKFARSCRTPSSKLECLFVGSGWSWPSQVTRIDSCSLSETSPQSQPIATHAKSTIPNHKLVEDWWYLVICILMSHTSSESH